MFPVMMVIIWDILGKIVQTYCLGQTRISNITFALNLSQHHMDFLILSRSAPPTFHNVMATTMTMTRPWNHNLFFCFQLCNKYNNISYCMVILLLVWYRENIEYLFSCSYQNLNNEGKDKMCIYK